MSYTNQQVATMKPATIAELFGLSTSQNGWHYRASARAACDAGLDAAEFQPRKRRDASQSTASPSNATASQSTVSKPVKAVPGPLSSMDAKTAAVAQLLAVSLGVSFSAATLRPILEASSQLPELAFLDGNQLASLKKWAGCKDRSERVAEFISQQGKLVYTADQNKRMALSLMQQGYQVTIPEAVEDLLTLAYANSLVQPGAMDLAVAGQIEQYQRNAMYGFGGFDGHLAGCFII